jgi:hypothetical protein
MESPFLPLRLVNAAKTIDPFATDEHGSRQMSLIEETPTLDLSVKIRVYPWLMVVKISISNPPVLSTTAGWRKPLNRRIR